MIFQKGQTFEQQFVVSEVTHEDFMLLFKDRNPLHTVAAFAEAKGFKGVVMHGNILNGFVSYFIGECLPTKDVIIHSQNITFKNPVYQGDALAFKATVADVFESVQAVEFKFTFKNDAGQTVALGKVQIGILP